MFFSDSSMRICCVFVSFCLFIGWWIANKGRTFKESLLISKRKLCVRNEDERGLLRTSRIRKGVRMALCWGILCVIWIFVVLKTEPRLSDRDVHEQSSVSAA